MASTGSVYPLDSIKGRKGNVIVVGRAKFGNLAQLEARDFGLRRLIASPTFTPNFGDRFQMVAGSSGSSSTKRYDRTFVVVAGSLGSGGSLNNYTKVRAYYAQTFGSFTIKSAAAQGTKGIYLGTRAGSMNFSFVAIGN